jgi:hypothetical protein
VVLVGVGQDEDVDPAVPGWQPPIELDEEAVRIRAGVDEHPTAVAALDEDRVALADVEDGDPRRAVDPVREREAETGRRRDEGDQGETAER